MIKMMMMAQIILLTDCDYYHHCRCICMMYRYRLYYYYYHPETMELKVLLHYWPIDDIDISSAPHAAADDSCRAIVTTKVTPPRYCVVFCVILNSQTNLSLLFYRYC